MQTKVVIFPFDLFGSSGTAAGAELLGDAIREMLADNRRERVPIRAEAYTDKVQIVRQAFETLSDYEEWRQRGRRLSRKTLEAEDFLLWITGNHLGALPIYDELGGESSDTVIIQFDAHLDIHNFRECTSEPSHGNFMLHGDGRLPPIINVGHRDLLLMPDYIDKYFQRTINAESLLVHPDEAISTLRKCADVHTHVFVDIDCDVLDSAFFPAVANPLPFGLTPTHLLRCLDAIGSDRLIGLSISEFDPARDRNDQSLSLLLWLVEHLLLRLTASVKRARTPPPRSLNARGETRRGQ